MPPIIKSNVKNRYPDARIKGIKEFLNIVKTEQEWTPDKVTVETLKTLDIARGKETNAIFTLKFLELINEDGSPTEEFNNLRENYIDALSRIIKSSYKKIFNNIPIRLMNQKTLVNFFTQQGYTVETAEYQAKLFVALCEEAVIELPNIEKSFKRARFLKET